MYQSAGKMMMAPYQWCLLAVISVSNIQLGDEGTQKVKRVNERLTNEYMAFG